VAGREDIFGGGGWLTGDEQWRWLIGSASIRESRAKKSGSITQADDRWIR